jgi:hypothetical protein
VADLIGGRSSSAAASAGATKLTSGWPKVFGKPCATTWALLESIVVVGSPYSARTVDP